MTVSYVGDDHDRRCTCMWFQGAELRTGDFYPEALTAASAITGGGWS